MWKSISFFLHNYLFRLKRLITFFSYHQNHFYYFLFFFIFQSAFFIGSIIYHFNVSLQIFLFFKAFPVIQFVFVLFVFCFSLLFFIYLLFIHLIIFSILFDWFLEIVGSNFSFSLYQKTAISINENQRLRMRCNWDSSVFSRDHYVWFGLVWLIYLMAY